MALVVITISDKPTGVDVHMAAEPRPTEDMILSPAQSLGAAALNAIYTMLDSEEMNRPRIILADATDLPN